MKHITYQFGLLCLLLISSTGSFAQIDLEWLKSVDGQGGDVNLLVKQDFANNIVVVGITNGTLDLDPGSASNSPAPKGKNDYYLQKFDQVGNLIWAKRFGSPEDDMVSDLMINSSGEIYISGNVSDLADLDPGPGTATANAASGDGYFVQKLNPNGSLQWLKIFHGMINLTLDFDASESLLIAGSYAVGADFDPGPATYTVANMGTNSVCLIKLNPQGIFKWAQPFDAPLGADLIHTALTTDNDKNIFLVGRLYGSFDFDLGAGTSILTSNLSGYNQFILKLDSTASFIWVRLIQQIRPVSVNCDSNGNLVLCGSSWLGADLDPGPSTFILSTANPTATALDGFILKLSGANGSLLWARGIANSGGAEIHSANFLPNDEIFIEGTFRDSCNFKFNGAPQQNLKTQALYSCFIAQVSSSGNYRWHKTFEAPGISIGGKTYVSRTFDILFVGGIIGVCDMDPGPGTALAGSNSSSLQGAAFVIKYNSKTLSIKESIEETITALYPNPNNGTFRIHPEQNCRIEIFDLNGILKYQKDLLENEDNEVESSFQKGIYVVRLVAIGKSDFYSKLIIQ